LANSHLVVVPHTHWDREWYRTHEDFRSRLVRLLDGLLDLLENDPAFRHFTLDGQTIVLDDYLAVRPGARDRIAALVRSGRLLIGPWFVLPDEWLVSGEALIRNLRRGLADAEAYGAVMPVGYVPDQFGHVGQLPQIFSGFGFETAALWRGVGANVDDVVFEWEAPNGSRVFTIYLRSGYGNGVDLPLDPDALRERIGQEVRGHRERSESRSLLMMNGSDHREPQPGLPAALRTAAEGLEDIDCELGTLPGFVARVREEAPASLAIHRGELRSGLRSPLLEGCASSRMPQKRADFENDRTLTRYLEPLAAWLSAQGGDADVERIEFAWRVALENHPHDSICGCSIDAVHREMDVRFARTAEIAAGHLRVVAAELGARVAAPKQRSGRKTSGSILVWNPNAGGRTRAEGRVEFNLPPGALRAPPLHVRDGAGRRIPAEVDRIEAGATFAEYEFPASVVAIMLGGFPGEFFGERVCAIEWSRRKGRRVLDVLMGEEEPVDFDFAEAKQEALEALAKLANEPVLYRVRRLARISLRFVDEFPGCGLRRYAVARGRAGEAESELRAERDGDGGAWIENDAWRIEVGADGRVNWRNRRTGALTSNALLLCSEGDRGDTYNFDPVPSDVPVSHPTRARIVRVMASESSARVVFDWTYRLPVELRADREARSHRRVPLVARVEMRLHPGLDRIDLSVDLDNRVRDHRLRLELRAPFAADRFEVESAFEVAERPIAPARDAFGSETPAEFPIGATPQRSFATVSAGSEALTVANRGAAEVEAIPEEDGTTLVAVTVLRAVGWLSRGDLGLRPSHAGPALPTPGAQVPGPHRIEVSVRAHGNGDSHRTAEAHRYAFPPLVFAGGGSAAGPPSNRSPTAGPSFASTTLRPRRSAFGSGIPSRVRVHSIASICGGGPPPARTQRSPPELRAPSVRGKSSRCGPADSVPIGSHALARGMRPSCGSAAPERALPAHAWDGRSLTPTV